MPSRIKTLLALFCLLAIGAFASQIWLDRPEASAQADSASCAVYRSFYSQFPEKSTVFFRSASRPYNPTHSGFHNQALDEKAAVFRQTSGPDNRKQGQGAPTRFERDTGKFKSVEISPNTEPYKKPIREAFEKDTSGFFEPLLSDKAVSLKPCFDERSHQPNFYDGSYKTLRIREDFLSLFRRDNKGLVTIWSVSPVGLSEDGRHALLYAEHYCNALCAGGAFYLFELRGGSWTEIGDNWIWVS